MRLHVSVVAIFAVVASSARTACIPYESRSPDWSADGVARRAEIVMTAEVVKAQNASGGQSAEIRPIAVYKGNPSPTVVMSLPPTDEIFTEAYAGFETGVGERPFLVLYASPSGFKPVRATT